MQVIADCCLDEREVKIIRERFNYLDADHDGHITIEDMVTGLRKKGLPITEEDAKAMFEAVSHQLRPVGVFCCKLCDHGQSKVASGKSCSNRLVTTGVLGRFFLFSWHGVMVAL